MKKIDWQNGKINGWLCTGSELKARSGASSADTYIFNGREIKPKSGANSQNTWVFLRLTAK